MNPELMGEYLIAARDSGLPGLALVKDASGNNCITYVSSPRDE
jgi:hypothetical protein